MHQLRSAWESVVARNVDVFIEALCKISLIRARPKPGASQAPAPTPLSQQLWILRTALEATSRLVATAAGSRQGL